MLANRSFTPQELYFLDQKFISCFYHDIQASQQFLPLLSQILQKSSPEGSS